MTIRLIYSEQYRKPCVVALPTDAADAVIAACRAGGAVMSRCSRPAPGGEWDVPLCHDEFVVQLRDDVGPELWTEAVLRRSLGKGCVR